MKRILLIILTLAALLVMPLIITGCGCGDGITLTDSDIATIRGFGTRLDSHDSSIATINNTLNSLNPETLAALASLDADEMTALLDLDLYTALSDISQLKSDMSTLKGTTLPDIENRVEDLENGNPNNDGTSTSGEVTVTLDGEVPLEVYTDEDITSPYRFTTTIINGTEDWKAVSYCVNFTCTSVDGKAKVEVAELTVSSLSYGGVPILFTTTNVPEEANAWLVFFTPEVDFEVVVSPGKTITLYHTIKLETADFELWEVTLTGVTVKKL